MLCQRDERILLRGGNKRRKAYLAGRMTRREYWSFAIIGSLPIDAVVAVIAMGYGFGGIVGCVCTLVYCALYCIIIYIMIARRLHDIGYSAWEILNPIPFHRFILLCAPSQEVDELKKPSWFRHGKVDWKRASLASLNIALSIPLLTVLFGWECLVWCPVLFVLSFPYFALTMGDETVEKNERRALRVGLVTMPLVFFPMWISKSYKLYKRFKARVSSLVPLSQYSKLKETHLFHKATYNEPYSAMVKVGVVLSVVMWLMDLGITVFLIEGDDSDLLVSLCLSVFLSRCFIYGIVAAVVHEMNARIGKQLETIESVDYTLHNSEDVNLSSEYGIKAGRGNKILVSYNQDYAAVAALIENGFEDEKQQIVLSIAHPMVCDYDAIPFKQFASLQLINAGRVLELACGSISEDEKRIIVQQVSANYITVPLDTLECAIASVCGTICGLIDAFFPSKSNGIDTEGMTDMSTAAILKKFAKSVWNAMGHDESGAGGQSANVNGMMGGFATWRQSRR